jgi:hypothetical protein
VTSSACGTTTCTNTPTTVLTLGSYTWKVRAYISGAWNAFSSTKPFTLETIGIAFDWEFTTNSSGWTPLNGSWSVASGYYQTTGINNSWVSSKHSGSYKIFTYTVKMEQVGCLGCAYGLYFNGTPAPIANKAQWYQGYGFFINNMGWYEVCRFSSNNDCAYQVPQTQSPYITNSWNILQVTYNNSTHYVQFYINGHKIVTGHFTAFTSGQVGLTMYTSSSHLYVDYAKMSLSAPSASVAGDGLGSDGSIFADESAVKGLMGADDMVAP